MTKSSSPQEMFDMFQRMMNPMAIPMQSLLFPNLSIEDLERKIGELKSIESWLTANLSMLQLSIKTMEYQHALLSGSKEGGKAGATPENPFVNPALWPWNMMGGKTDAAPDAPKSDAKKSPEKK